MGMELNVKNEENDQNFSEPGAFSKDKNCSEFQESLRHIDNEHAKDSLENTNIFEPKPLDTGSFSALQNNFVNENTKERLTEEKTNFAKQVQ